MICYLRMSESSETTGSDNKKEEEVDQQQDRQSGAWTVNEILPVIHEEREKGRNSSNSADSICSDSNRNTLRNDSELRSGLPVLEPIDEESRSVGPSSLDSPNMLTLDSRFSKSLPKRPVDNEENPEKQADRCETDTRTAKENDPSLEVDDNEANAPEKYAPKDSADLETNEKRRED
ncbi:unnamed protein product [Bursaphelenchus xylophilus]|nr:unnamed protein product [Bursaphelenchus xylophilus]CAG9096785.1 unnamed protein product [Bursaphelenchus xylophilus]